MRGILQLTHQILANDSVSCLNGWRSVLTTSFWGKMLIERFETAINSRSSAALPKTFLLVGKYRSRSGSRYTSLFKSLACVSTSNVWIANSDESDLAIEFLSDYMLIFDFQEELLTDESAV